MLTTLKKGLLKRSGVYLVTDRHALKGKDIVSVISRSLEAGVDMVQLRDAEMPDQEFLDIGREIKRILEGRDCLFIVNDRVDLASILESDGVHLGQDDMSTEKAREILGPEKIIGLSTHSTDQVEKAVEKDVDYISVGPVFPTPTKPDYKAVGLGPVRLAAKRSRIPFVAIGGINESNIKDVVRAGAKRVAVVRAILSSNDPFTATRNFLTWLK